MFLGLYPKNVNASKTSDFALTIMCRIKYILVAIACLCGVAYCLFMCSPARIKTVRIIVPSSTTGLFQVEGRSESPNTRMEISGGIGTIVIPNNSRYAGLRGLSPLISWHTLEVVDPNNIVLPRANTVNEIREGERSVLVLGIAGRSQLSWFAVGTREELLAAIDDYSRRVTEGRLSLP